VFILSDSIALLADLIHNIADASTAIPLGLAFLVGRWRPTRKFSYGYGRAEDLAGVAVVAIIAFSALVTGYESVERLLHPHALNHLGALITAGIIGFIGNGVVSLFRIRVGQEIGSAALVADGYHARADSLVSLAVVVGAVGVWLGFPQADPIVGLLITAVLFHIVWDAGKTMLIRMMDGVDPDVVDAIEHALDHVADVQAVHQIRARWLGHRLYAEVAIGLSPTLSIQEGQVIAQKVQAQLQEHIPYLAQTTVQIQANQFISEASVGRDFNSEAFAQEEAVDQQHK
jgi:cation diffusion facilitator family transporter